MSGGAVGLLGIVHAHPLTAALLALRRTDGVRVRSGLGLGLRLGLGLGYPYP